MSNLGVPKHSDGSQCSPVDPKIGAAFYRPDVIATSIYDGLPKIEPSMNAEAGKVENTSTIESTTTILFDVPAN